MVFRRGWYRDDNQPDGKSRVTLRDSRASPRLGSENRYYSHENCDVLVMP